MDSGSGQGEEQGLAVGVEAESAEAERAGDDAISQGRYDQAVKAYALALVNKGGDGDHAAAAALLVKRARGLVQLARLQVSRPSSESDHDRRLGPDSQTLASLACRDLSRAIDVGSLPAAQLADVYHLKGDAQIALEEYPAAVEAIMCGLGYDPLHAGLLASLKRCRQFDRSDGCCSAEANCSTEADEATGTKTAAVHEGRQAAANAQGSDRASTNQGAVEGGSGPGGSRDDLQCGICRKLLYDPVTTPSGHSFCRRCLEKALSRDQRCPATQKVVHLNARRHPVSVNLQNILLKSHQTETKARALEVEAEAAASAAQEEGGVAHDVLPIFTLDYVVPGQTMALNMFEPRYRLMTRRCMDGDRKFGVMGVRGGAPPVGGGGGHEQVNRDGAVAVLAPRRRQVGTEVEIVEARQLFDGRCHVRIKATVRFEVLSQWEMDGYCCARVRFFRDEGEDSTLTKHRSRVPRDSGPKAGAEAAILAEKRRKLHQEIEAVVGEAQALVEEWLQRALSFSTSSPHLAVLLRNLIARAGAPPAVTEVELYSFWIANVIPTSTTEKVQLIETVSTRERLQLCITFLTETLRRTQVDTDSRTDLSQMGASD